MHHDLRRKSLLLLALLFLGTQFAFTVHAFVDHEPSVSDQCQLCHHNGQQQVIVDSAVVHADNRLSFAPTAPATLDSADLLFAESFQARAPPASNAFTH